MKTYEIRLPFCHYELGLCNQLCQLMNAIEDAIQIVTLGRGVVLKPNLKTLWLNGHIFEKIPEAGYRPVDGVYIGFPTWMRPPCCRLDFEWKEQTQINFMSVRGNDSLHWLDEVPDEVCIYVEFFRPLFNGHDIMRFDDVIDIDAMNELLKPMKIRICYGERGYSLDIMFRAHCVRSSTMFRSLINMIRFTETSTSKVREFKYEEKRQHEKTSVVHIRNETDAIFKWARDSNIPIEIFTQLCHQKYIDTIKEHINPNESDVIVLTTDPENNDIVKWMYENGYVVHFLPKTPIKTEAYQDELGRNLVRYCLPENNSNNNEGKQYRELQAVCDLEMGKMYCDHTFIGACNIDTLGGSSFSHFLFCMLGPDVKKVLIDLDNINSTPKIYT